MQLAFQFYRSTKPLLVALWATALASCDQPVMPLELVTQAGSQALHPQQDAEVLQLTATPQEPARTPGTSVVLNGYSSRSLADCAIIIDVTSEAGPPIHVEQPLPDGIGAGSLELSVDLAETLEPLGADLAWPGHIRTRLRCIDALGQKWNSNLEKLFFVKRASDVYLYGQEERGVALEHAGISHSGAEAGFAWVETTGEMQ